HHPAGRTGFAWLADSFHYNGFAAEPPRPALHVKVLIFLLLTDAAIIGFHVLLGLMVMAGQLPEIPARYSIGHDWSIGEMSNYIKWFSLIVVMLAAWERWGSPIFPALAFLFTVALLDDSTQIHENNNEFAGRVSHLDGSETSFFHELVIWIVLGLIVAVPLLLSWLRTDRQIKSWVIRLLALFGGVVFCAVVVDYIHTLPEQSTFWAGVLGVLEDGGEMLFLTAMVSYAVAAIRPQDHVLRLGRR
ncbi:MAG: hypothetical protein Q4G49_15345, partial [Paracoccus sp. (in: a-proteobacteria)]|nr:hypothetical protein [Paracoccus sp. (in: a-proteobacteria)]